MKFCRNCQFWNYCSLWKGNCSLHPWHKPKWSQSALACNDYAPPSSFHTSSYFESSGVGVGKPCSATLESPVLGSRMPPSRKTKGDSPQYNVVGYVEGF